MLPPSSSPLVRMDCNDVMLIDLTMFQPLRFVWAIHWLSWHHVYSCSAPLDKLSANSLHSQVFIILHSNIFLPIIAWLPWTLICHWWRDLTDKSSSLTVQICVVKKISFESCHFKPMPQTPRLFFFVLSAVENVISYTTESADICTSHIFIIKSQQLNQSWLSIFKF